MNTPPFATMLLAGGRSQRMGRDKAFLESDNEFLWQVQLRKLQALKPFRLLLSCREEQQANFGLIDPAAEWFFDPPDFQLGPLGVIYQALEAVQMPLVVMAVDMPCMSHDFIRDAFLAPKNFLQGRCFSTALGLEPLTALYVPSMLPMMKESLTAGLLSLQKLLLKGIELGMVEVMSATSQEERFFSNCNTPDEWKHEKGRLVRPA